MTDEEIVALFFDRDQSAIEKTSELYGKKLYSLSYRVLFDEGASEECVNDTYMRAWESIPPDDPKDHLYPYLARIARCFAIDRYRYNHMQKRDAQITSLTDEIDTCLMITDGGNQIFDKLAFSESMNSFLGGLKKDQRVIFLRRYWYMDEISEIAEKYGYSVSKVKSTLMRVRNKLRDHLLKDGIIV